MQEPIEAEVVDLGIDLISDAVSLGPDSAKFDIARKILTLATALGEDVASAEKAARQADNALFSKSMAYKVGAGELTPEEATETIVDRNASSFVTVAREFVAEAVETGCEIIGGTIGSMFGNPAAGYAVGSAVGHFLNKPVGELVSRGAPKIVSYVRDAWQTTKRVVGGFVNKVADWFFS
jgi:hypothetical protein